MRTLSRKLIAVCAVILIIGLSIAAVADRTGGNFSQYPGFREHFEAFPRHTIPASPRERLLLERYRPRLFLGPGEEGPISFYDDYIASGTLYDGSGRVITQHVNRELLNAYADDPRVVFVHQPARASGMPVVFGRVDRADVPGSGIFTFFTYHFVFRHSGLPAGMPNWIRAGIELIADVTDWHQLDHYTMARIAFDRGGIPVAAILQQHNDVRSYILGRDMPMPPDGRIMIDAAVQSNELYPHEPSRRRHRAVTFLTTESASYLITGRHKPWLSADDMTDPKREREYRLDFLPPTDAFYTFHGYLGERRWLPGRSGPPGADYNTLPRFKPLAVELVAFNWREGDLAQMADLRTFLSEPSHYQEAFTALTTRFRFAVACQLRKDRADCRP